MLCEIESGLCTFIFLHIVLNTVWNFCVKSQYNARNESQVNLLTQSIGHDIPSSLTTRQSLCPTWIPIDYLYTELMGIFTGRYHRCGFVMGWKLDNERALVFISIIEMSRVSWYLKWPVTRMFVQHLIKDIKTPYDSIFVREIHGCPVASETEREVKPKAFPNMWWLYICARLILALWFTLTWRSCNNLLHRIMGGFHCNHPGCQFVSSLVLCLVMMGDLWTK